MSMHECSIARATFPRCGKVLPIGAVVVQVLRRYELTMPVDQATPWTRAGVCPPAPIGVHLLVTATPTES